MKSKFKVVRDFIIVKWGQHVDPNTELESIFNAAGIRNGEIFSVRTQAQSWVHRGHLRSRFVTHMHCHIVLRGSLLFFPHYFLYVAKADLSKSPHAHSFSRAHQLMYVLARWLSCLFQSHWAFEGLVWIKVEIGHFQLDKRLLLLYAGQNETCKRLRRNLGTQRQQDAAPYAPQPHYPPLQFHLGCEVMHLHAPVDVPSWTWAEQQLKHSIKPFTLLLISRWIIVTSASALFEEHTRSCTVQYMGLKWCCYETSGKLQKRHFGIMTKHRSCERLQL